MKILVIGGGMAGLTYAIVACKNGYDVTVAERNARLGKKLSQTGNGKCNIGNVNVNKFCFNDSPLAEAVLRRIPFAEYERFLHSCGIFTYTDAQGRVYPLSDSASNVVDCLRYQLSKYGADIHCNCQITKIKKVKQGFAANVDGISRVFDKVVLACGSGSSAPDPEIFDIVPQSMFTPLCPSLVPVKIQDMPPILNGLRVKANVSLTMDGKKIAEQQGEVQFKDYGLSGICILNLSAAIARNTVLRKQGKYVFHLDCVPNMTLEQLTQILIDRIDVYHNDALFYGILHNKLAEYVLRICGGSGATAQSLARTAKNLIFDFDRLLDWSMSQVTAGGISVLWVNPDGLVVQNGLVALGEILDVDGLCGGNNLYFAAASALSTFTEEQRKRAFSRA